MTAGQRVLITGSTRGIGRAAAECLLKSGADVIIHGRAQDDVNEAVAALTATAATVSGVAGDLIDRAAIAEIASRAGDVDALVNCAGIYREVPVGEIDAANWAATIETNLTAPWLLTRALLAGLRRRRGVVVNIASDAGLVGYPNATTYCASKGGLIGLTKALAVELAPDVRAIAICPGPVATDMMTDSVAAAADPVAELQKWTTNTMLRRVAQPHEIGALIAFACSPAASFATGAIWSIDGGVTAGRRV